MHSAGTVSAALAEKGPHVPMLLTCALRTTLPLDRISGIHICKRCAARQGQITVLACQGCLSIC
jgi:hypothetical protein